MPKFDVSASSPYQCRRHFVDASTREEALRSFVEYYSDNSLDGLDYARPLWVVEFGGNNGIAGIFNGDSEVDARAAYAQAAGFRSLESFNEWEHELDRERQRDRGIADEDIEEKEDDEVASIDIARVEAFEA